MVGPTSKVSEMSSVPTRPEKDLVEVRSPTSSYLSVALLLENSGTVLAKLPDALYRILLMVKEAEKRPDAPGTDRMKPLADKDILMRDEPDKKDVNVWQEEKGKENPPFVCEKEEVLMSSRYIGKRFLYEPWGTKRVVWD